MATSGQASRAKGPVILAWLWTIFMALAAGWALQVDVRLLSGVTFAPGTLLPWPVGIAAYAGALVVARRLQRRTLRYVAHAFAALYLPVLLGLVGLAGVALAGLVGIELWLGYAFWRWLRDGMARRRDPLLLHVGRQVSWPHDPVVLGGEDRFLHLHVLGPTGSGKTTGVLLPLWEQDVRRSVGLTILDPKGDLAEAAARIAEAAGRTVTRIGPGEQLGIDPLAGDPLGAAETAAYALDRAFGGDHPFYRPLGQTLVRFSVRALKEVVPTAGLGELTRFWTDEEERLSVLVRVKDPDVRAYFRDVVANWPRRARVEYLAGLQNALFTLLGSPTLAGLWRTDPAIDLTRHLESSDGVLVVNLSMAELGAAAPLAGAFILSAYIRAALHRGVNGSAHFLYVDEVGSFAPGGMGDFLAVARGYRVGTVLAHQNMGQLSQDLRRAMWANARSRLVLGGTAPEDARAVAELSGVSPDGTPRLAAAAVRDLPRGQAWALVSRRGSAEPAQKVRLAHRALDA